MRTSAELVEILDNYLKKKKISRRQFCALVDIPNSTISSWKSKNVLPSIEFVSKVAKFMNVSLDWLVYSSDIESELEKDDFLYQEYKQNREQFQEYLKVRDSLKNIFS